MPAEVKESGPASSAGGRAFNRPNAAFSKLFCGLAPM